MNIETFPVLVVGNSNAYTSVLSLCRTSTTGITCVTMSRASGVLGLSRFECFGACEDGFQRDPAVVLN